MPRAESVSVPAQGMGSFSARTTEVQMTAAASAARASTYGQDVPSASQVGANKNAVTGCQGVNVLQNNGRVAHQVVPHVHFHIIPRTEGDAFHFNWPAGSYPPGKIEELAPAPPVEPNLIS